LEGEPARIVVGRASPAQFIATICNPAGARRAGVDPKPARETNLVRR